ncbi:uncharacterized protein LOC132716321 isoform X1 [Ruditapes philippinarum]|uniref:uncharacterized protein LOC132716321 isoform X1 n=1 Tax=Ruditapes philippinarum TaxID=129788 RepID=UPI00295ABE74|nr:uncharacterized protein LOC132716321 isoform X1 [Ruditapes philippinarum]
MVLKSVSSVCLTKTGKTSSQAPSEPESKKSSRNSSGKVSIADVITSPSPVRSNSSRRSTLKAPSIKKNKISLVQVSTEITSVLLRKERQLRDHLFFLKSIFNVLRALHNLKVRDIRSKVPLSREAVERLQRDHFREEDYSRGTYVSRGRGTPASALHVEGDHGDGSHTAGRLSIFNTAKRANTFDNVTKSVFGRRKSKNVGTTERPALETWEDLLNVQPEPYKEKPGSGNIGFQMGVITKFMRWYRKVEDAVVTEREKRRASIVPQHGPIDNIHEKGTVSDKSEKGDRESTYTQPRPGSATQPTEKVKKLPIWLQVAQEKSTVYQDVTQSMPNPETTVQRCKRNLNKVKRSVQKENEAQLEKIVRERLATFRLKLLALNQEECSPLFEKEILKLDDKKGNVKLFHLENFDVQPSKWYEELKEQTMGMMSSYPQPEIADMLTKLQIYSHMDNKTLSYSKAKLCLLVMSLPAYDICQIYMQKALKFIFENIMLGQDTQLNEWLNHRKIPNVVTTDIFSRPESPFTDPD